MVLSTATALRDDWSCWLAYVLRSKLLRKRVFYSFETDLIAQHMNNTARRKTQCEKYKLIDYFLRNLIYISLWLQDKGWVLLIRRIHVKSKRQYFRQKRIDIGWSSRD